MWVAQAYGRRWIAPTFELLVEKIDTHGEAHNLRAVSVVAEFIEE